MRWIKLANSFFFLGNYIWCNYIITHLCPSLLFIIQSYSIVLLGIWSVLLHIWYSTMGRNLQPHNNVLSVAEKCLLYFSCGRMVAKVFSHHNFLYSTFYYNYYNSFLYYHNWIICKSIYFYCFFYQNRF